MVCYRLWMTICSGEESNLAVLGASLATEITQTVCGD
jgi:hypothetical protein